MSSGGVMLSGWLRKSPPERKLRRYAWKKRWFVLRSGRLSGDSNVLEYFRHQGSKKPIRAISLNECIQIDANVPIKYEKKDPSHQFVFDIVTKTRIYYLVAESSLEMASWVRYLCDLCGFNHDTPENQADLGSQQQTFKPDQTIAQRDNYPRNGSLSPLQDDNGSPEENGVPVPLPRPKKTMSVRSVLINKGNSSAESSVAQRDNNGVLHEEPRTSAGSGHASAAGTPQVACKLVSGKDGYSYAVNPLLSDSGSDYLLLADCKTALSDEANQSAHSTKLDERRQSTDSVFTHESRADDVMTDNDDVIISQAQKHPMRYITDRRNQRLDSMPNAPPPLPPGVQADKNYSNLLQQYSDDDEVSEARTRSRTSQGLCPIDDRDLKRVPLNLQREFRVDDMGNPLTGDSGWNNSLIHSPNFTTEYINTSDVSAEIGFPGKNHHHNSSSQSQSIASSTGQKGTTKFPVFNDRENDAYSQQRRTFFQMLPPHQFRNISVPKSPPSANMYSSAHVLDKTPAYNSSSPSKTFANVLAPMQKIRRSSSVGQLEVVANELAAKTEYKVAYPRRRSIDYNAANAMGYNRYNTGVNNSANFGSNLAIPPPRPPKSEFSKQTMSNIRQDFSNLPNDDKDKRFGASVSPPPIYYRPNFEPPDSPPHSMVIGVIENKISKPAELKVLSPEHSTITYTIPVAEVKRYPLPSDSRSVSLSSTGSGSTSASGSSRSRSPAGTYEVSSGKIQSSSKIKVTKADSNNNQKRGLSGINDQLPTYEPMLNQSEMEIPEKPDMSLYTCMAGATTLINKPAFPHPSKPVFPQVPTLTSNGPPPIQRDLKPGPRKSLDSDGSGDISQRPPYPKSSIDEADGMHISNQLLKEQISSHPHTMGHYSTSPNIASPWLAGYSDTLPPRRLQPPERPPKHSQSSLSPRSPPSVTLPLRSNAYGIHKTMYDGQKMQSPFTSGLQQKSPANVVPDRPPKPESLKSGSSSSLLWERLPPAVITTASDFSNSPQFFRKSPVVPPPALNPEQELKYIELLDLHPSDHTNAAERNEPKVEYIKLDKDKTQALEKITKTRNQDPSSHKRFDSKSNKLGK